jgi:hypothetical protein
LVAHERAGSARAVLSFGTQDSESIRESASGCPLRCFSTRAKLSMRI